MFLIWRYTPFRSKFPPEGPPTRAATRRAAVEHGPVLVVVRGQERDGVCGKGGRPDDMLGVIATAWVVVVATGFDAAVLASTTPPGDATPPLPAPITPSMPTLFPK